MRMHFLCVCVTKGVRVNMFLARNKSLLISHYMLQQTVTHA